MSYRKSFVPPLPPVFGGAVAAVEHEHVDSAGADMGAWGQAQVVRVPERQ